ncbi:MAG: IS3 family transposase [Thermoleophilia bacterium]|nr:IS3 family transposase [Thermoleophilia bacterium]
MRRLRAGHKAAAHLAFELIREETAFCKALTVRLACQTLDVSRAGYYAWRERAPSKRSVYDAALKKRIRFFFDRSDGTYGARRIHFDLLDDGHQIGRCRVERLMREMNVQGHQKRLRRRVRQLHDEGLHAMDLVQREWHPTGRDQIWVADITQIPTWEGPLYLAAVLDVFSRRIVGWAMADHMRAELVIGAFEMALAARRPAPGLIHHSDHGSQYTSYAFGKTLRTAGVLPSMGRVRTCFDNAVAESFFATLKKDRTNRRSWRNRHELRSQVFDYVEGWYNTHRRHSSLGNISPAEFERRHAS